MRQPPSVLCFMNKHASCLLMFQLQANIDKQLNYSNKLFPHNSWLASCNIYSLLLSRQSGAPTKVACGIELTKCLLLMCILICKAFWLMAWTTDYIATSYEACMVLVKGNYDIP